MLLVYHQKGYQAYNNNARAICQGFCWRLTTIVNINVDNKWLLKQLFVRWSFNSMEICYLMELEMTLCSCFGK